MDAVEVDRVWVLGRVRELDAQAIALRRPDRRARDAPVVRPGREEDPGSDLYLFVDRDELVFADRAA
jgi:hypothetical protein